MFHKSSIANRNKIANQIRQLLAPYNLKKYAVRNALSFSSCIAENEKEKVLKRSQAITEDRRPKVIQAAIPGISNSNDTLSSQIELFKKRKDLKQQGNYYPANKIAIIDTIDDDQLENLLFNELTILEKSDIKDLDELPEEEYQHVKDRALMRYMLNLSDLDKKKRKLKYNLPVIVKILIDDDSLEKKYKGIVNGEYIMASLSDNNKWLFTNFLDIYEADDVKMFQLYIHDFPEKEYFNYLSSNDKKLIEMINQTEKFNFSTILENVKYSENPTNTKETWTIDKIKLVADDVERTKAAECESFAAFLVTKLRENIDIGEFNNLRVQLIAHKENMGIGTHNYVLINFEGEELSYEQIRIQSDRLLIGDLWLYALGHIKTKNNEDTQGIYTLEGYPMSHSMLDNLVEIFDSNKDLTISKGSKATIK